MIESESVEPKSYVLMSFNLPPLIITPVPALGGGSILALLNLLFSALGQKCPSQFFQYHD